MSLTLKPIDGDLTINKENPGDKVIALAGNPNVGKSTVFNALTGLNQHTGNWPGKTVMNAQGKCSFDGINYVMVDIPGTYSLMAHSAEEEVARDFICFGHTDAVIVVCDATCLERNMNLVLQTIEITDHVVVCVNLMDEAKKKHIQVDFGSLQKDLGVPVVGISARSGKKLDKLMEAVGGLSTEIFFNPIKIKYNIPIEQAIAILEPSVKELLGENLNSRWIALRLIDYDESLMKSLENHLGCDITKEEKIAKKISEARTHLEECGISGDTLRDKIVSCLVMTAEGICADAVSFENLNYNARDRKIDRVLTNKWSGFPIMLLLLTLIFWITITGANYPSALISDVLFRFQDVLLAFFTRIGAPQWVTGMLVMGIYRVLAWVVSVMLPPMAIFFPLFTLLEDLGYLPRVAFNLDKYFKKSHACGKQALTM